MYGFMPVRIYTYIILVLHIKKTNSEKSPVFKKANKQTKTITAISTHLKLWQMCI